MPAKSISIIGLGLIGGSLAKAFRKNNSTLKIYSVDSCMQSLSLAESDGTIDKGFIECCPEIYSSDIIFICTPIKRAIWYIEQLCGNINENCIITDVASTKGEICNYVEALEKPPIFIGGHPMAGTEKSGYSNAFAHLFENAYYVLTPTKTSTEAALAAIKALLTGIGSIPIIVPPAEHDLITGCISHVPHIIASTLVTLAKNNENDDGLVKLLAAGGFKDITRIASSSPIMWENIVLSNNKVIIDLLDSCKNIVDDMILNIKNSDNEKIFDFFNNAKTFRDSFAQAKGLIPENFELLVDIKDEPGIIGKIATLLGNNEINIKNINVSNSREFEQGCLRITLSDRINTDKAFEILSRYSYEVFRKD
jgi:prephenate dehydrogenase